MNRNQLTNQDRESLQKRGMSCDEVLRQWSILRDATPRVVLDRPCTIGDGIDRLASNEHDSLMEAHRQAAAIGRWSKFTPASGAASRMFALHSAADKQRLCESIARMPFAERLQEQLSSQGHALGKLVQSQQFDSIVDCMLSDEGLSYDTLPKGLIEFHQYDAEGESRTAFEEHVLEGSECFAGPDGKATLHFTVSPEHQSRFEQTLDRIKRKHNLPNCEVSFSVQHPSTDTIAVDDSGALIRDQDGAILLRPGGHGALIENLSDYGGDLVFVKNIDNVRHGRDRDESLQWMRMLGGYTALVQTAIFHHLEAIKGGGKSVAAAHDFVKLTFGDAACPASSDLDQLRSELVTFLRRPLRVCGMVKNEGEPGGGPFWVRGSDGRSSIQIVEAAEVDDSDESQREILHRSTHFNPVFMALAIRDQQGNPYDLRDFVDHDRPIITRKPIGGKQATVIEKPGLWNGGMACWNTIFIEVPAAVFTPVKTVFDLLRDEHQPADALPSDHCDRSIAGSATTAGN